MLSLATEFERLNREQKLAVKESGNTVVLAGPGSGKTATLVIKVAHLLSGLISPPQGLACITYNNDTVKEFRLRLAEFGIYPSANVFLGTVHSFCLNCILRPFSPLLFGDSREIQVVGENESEALLAHVFDEVGRNDNPAWFKATLTKIRRARDCGEDLRGFQDQDVEIASRYVQLLHGSSRVDFDEMVSKALSIVRGQDWVCQLLANRFPWLIIDEYQDLGGPLDSIVTTLLAKEDLRIFAVGDPDQTIYDFTGANPKYLLALASRADFRAIRLKFNYRSGRRLITASQAALAPSEPRNYKPDPLRKDEGEVLFFEAQAELESYADVLTNEIIPELKARNVALDETAILYRQKGSIVTAIQTELTSAEIPFIAEKESDYPRALVIRWLQDCASRAIDDWGEVLFEDLVRFYHRLCYVSGHAESNPDLDLRTRLHETLRLIIDLAEPLGAWLLEMDRALWLREMLASLPEYADDISCLDSLIVDTQPGGRLCDHSVADFATDARLKGKIVLTTMHSSKGRQFDAVILPGLAEGLLPSRRWDKRARRYAEPTAITLAEDRRLFYVGFTRARKVVALISAHSYINNYGYSVDLGESRFVTEIRTRLQE